MSILESADPIRDELFSVERLEEHAEWIARQRTLAKGETGRPLSPRVRDSGRVLLECYRAIAAVIRDEGAITPAADWFVDNFHIVDEVVRRVREDLPRSFYRQLPKLAEGPLHGYPRVLGLAWTFVAHTDSRFEPDTLQRFVRRFQGVQPLTIGELWAVPIALRIVFLENLRRLAERIVTGRAARRAADALADELLGLAGQPARPLAFRPLRAATLPAAFTVQLVQRLREQDPESTPALVWLDEDLAGLGTSPDELVRVELRNQAATNLTVRNVITSMRTMAPFDWAEFFESVSLVDEALRADSNFGALDFVTRDRYRHAIEELARGSGRSELDVTREVVARTKGAERAASPSAPAGERSRDPAYHLISNGLPRFEQEIGYRVPLRQRIFRAYVSWATPGYFGTIAIVTALLLALPILTAYVAGMSVLALAVMGLLALLPASDLAVALINRSVTRLVGPKALPRLELRDGIPPSCRTLVVVPTLLTSEAAIEEHVNRLEIHYLANPDGAVHFALLSDWIDAAAEAMPGDDRLLAAALERVARLNRAHPCAPDSGDRFFLLHRRRIWNEGEGVWMGWERKRGKLDELNRLLRGASDTTFMAAQGRRPDVPAAVKYVVTLDADTHLPRGAVNRLVSTMAHPLNQPAFDPGAGRVVDGYGVLQPRITPMMPTDRDNSLFQRISSGPAGIDPYAAAVSDVYQDLFGEGSYTGKGIYDVDAFMAALAGRAPDNRLLSHDLFEGIFARSGLVTDIELFEEFPSDYEVAAARQHRWARGDWQLLPWILGAAAGPRRARVPLIGLWKMADNLRRTLSAPASWLALVAGWTLPHSQPLVWTAFVLVTVAVPALMPAFADIIPARSGISKRTHLRAVGRSFALAFLQIGLSLTFLAHQAWLMSDAIARTFARLYLTRRHLLEWTTAAQAKSDMAREITGAYQRMRGALILAVAGGALVAATRPGSAAVAAPFLLLWGLSPLAARWISRPPRLSSTQLLSPQDVRTLRATARRTWRFFETFVGPADAGLPPDNFQEDPKPVVAHRTSPTNIGLYLLSTIAARDFGWLGRLEALERLEATLATIGRLERFRGHLYNWYDTSGLRPLEPRYVSTVDSGNLAGHLLVLGTACQSAIHQPLLDPEALAGIEDALLLVGEAASALGGGRPTQTVTLGHLEETRAALAAGLPEPPGSPMAWAARLRQLAVQADTLVDIARTLTAERGDDEDAEILVWAQATRATIASHERDLLTIMPWAPHLDAALAALGHATPEAVRVVTALSASSPTPVDLAGRCTAAVGELTALRDARIRDGSGSAGETAPIDEAIARLEASSVAARALVQRVAAVSRAAREIFNAMQFGFLFDPRRKIFSIGYRIADGSLEPGAYDLLASEARLASFIAIAKGDVPVSHWFHLGRPMTPVVLGSALVSWSGSMFEYLMPALVMHSPPGSLLQQTYRLVVQRQISYGAEQAVPWGVSESAYNVRDLDLTYQYSNFGIPGLGLERGLSEDLVIAPYATALGAMVDPEAAARNLRRLVEVGGRGSYGFYEALDYTKSRLPEGTTVAVVRAYMAHHQGMTVLALVDVLREGVMRARFHAEPIVQATELLLQERVPRDVAVARPRVEEVEAPAHLRDFRVPAFRQFTSRQDPMPRTHLLSNGRYAVMLTAAGSGYSRCADLGVTRWHEDVTRDQWGTYIFLRDVKSGAVWSAGYQPTGVEPDTYRATFFEDRAEFHRRDGAITTTLEVLVSPEDDAEVRRVSVTNLGQQAREIEVTSYAELVLAPPAADAAHPAFSKLFVQTESLGSLGALLATRRVRAPDEQAVWAAHVLVAEDGPAEGVQYETDRGRFLGRGRGIRTPMSVIDGRPLSNTAGSVLDPIFCLRRRIRLEAGGSARLVFSTLVAGSRDAAVALADKYRDPATFDRAVTLAWTHAQVQLHHLGIDSSEAHLFQDLAGRILYSDPTLRPAADVLRRNTSGATVLWPYAISGDLPIVLVRIDEPEDRGIVRQLLRAHEYWRMKGLAVDLVVLNEKAHAYVEDLQNSLEALVRTSQSALRPDGPKVQGHVFILRGDRLDASARDALHAAARAVLLSRQGTLAEQLARAHPAQSRAVPLPRRPVRGEAFTDAPPRRPELEFWNGLGGFADDGREYVTVLGEGQWTPAPWINVIANPDFGFQVSECGAGYTWSVNSRENKLTAWSNDAISDPPGEAIYVRDEDTGALWGPTPLPIREETASTYVVRHGQGYSRFEHASHGIALDLVQFVPIRDSLKISRLTIENRSGKARRLSVTAYVEWVLGVSRDVAAPFIVTEVDPATRALLARNAWNPDFGDRVAFADLGGRQTAWTADRTEVLGKHGTLDHPALLERGDRPSGRVGAGLDPCAALQAKVDLPAGGRAEIVFFLGQAATIDEARSLLIRYRALDLDLALKAVTTQWDDIVGAVQVKTPDRSLDLMLNRWLLYQTLACRVWARSAFYQAGGAYGFRDQLQDVMALTVSARALAREHLLRAASRQFGAGDVQHWWHPPSGRGVRTRIADDGAWLPYAVAHYVEVTGDAAVLDEMVPFLDGPLLAPGQDDAYFQPAVSNERASLFEHCARALDRSLAVGAHGLPLMGTGDWNDGMNRVGHAGRGESVWLGWFLHTTLWELARLAEARGDRPRADTWRAHVRDLHGALEQHGWDGDWYRRAYFDDGTPLGSAANAECRIDSIAQSWAVISGAAEPGRAARAMAAVEEYLVRRAQELVLLFTPPFDGALDPGYIRGYPPGIRENGGQYTHAAIWSVMAFAALGDGDKANELFSILNPINRASTRAGVHRYKVEPYVAAADVYAEYPHVGRGGWTWYTGSAGWMYRAGIEWLLGFRVRGAVLYLDPCIPRAWRRFEIAFRYHASRYEVSVENPRGVPRGVSSVEVDGTPLPSGRASVPLTADGATHRIRVVLG